MASDLSSFVDVSAEDIPKSILVSGITPGTEREAIVFHFQQHKHGGGDASSVKFSQNGDKAVITFEEKESKFILLHNSSLYWIIQWTLAWQKSHFLKFESECVRY